MCIELFILLFIDLPHINFTHRFTDALPADPITDNYTRFVENAAYSWVEPTPTKTPKLVAITDDLALELGLNDPKLSQDELTKVLSGNALFKGMKPYAMCYGGHQFGSWANQLGDGRAINLGDILTPNKQHFTLQLKGAGPTPYSRRADGLAVLRSSIREFLCSEAMYHLGVPTTRALSLCLSGDHVMRDMFYDGNAKAELGAVVCRVSSSFVRFGNFQLPAKRGDAQLLTQLVHYCITHDYPHLLADKSPNDFTIDTYLAWFQEICDRTCKMVVNWMRVGFVHGVMNTDNMSIIGETIDYGPYGWIDAFDLDWTPNTTDKANGRYRFGAQANICQWNLFQLANAIYPLINDAAPLEAMLNGFAKKYQAAWRKMMAAKIGIEYNVEESNVTDTESRNDLFDDLESLLGMVETDMTLFYRALANIPSTQAQPLSYENSLGDHFSHCYYDPSAINEEYINAFNGWFKLYAKHLEQDSQSLGSRQAKMNAVNPKYVLRNYLAQQAIDLAEQGDFSELIRLQTVLQNPYDEQEAYEAYAQKRPDWARNKAGCSMLSCSS